MAYKGGYHIVDFKGGDINGGTIKGLYESLEGSYGKAILVAGLTTSGNGIREQFADVTLDGANYKLVLSEGTITVNENDSYIYTN